MENKDLKAWNWLNESQLGYDIWDNKYRYKGENFEQWLDRVSGGNKELRKLIAERKFLFGGRVLSNRNTVKKGSMSNCYSSGYAPDDIEGLMQLNTNLALTYKAQGGQGLSLSKVRPKGTSIGNQFTSDGIIPFMELFNTTTSSISQGGARKGALMISLDIMHKEAETFIKIKSNDDKITKANLSLEIGDEFMQAVDKYYTDGTIVTLHESRNYNGHVVEYDVIPIELYKMMMEMVYDWGEPGCLFTERLRNYNLMEFDGDYQIETTNPCGEQPLPKNMSCNLGSLNLAEFVENPYTKNAYFNYEEFCKAVVIAVEALDNIIDENLSKHALPEQAENSKNYRNVGLGCMGYATALFKLGQQYGSKEAIKFTDKLFHVLFKQAVWASCHLAQIKGTFPKYKECVFDSHIIHQHFSLDEIKELKKDGIRNCSLISIAPNGSISTMLGVSGGCEPEFALSYKRRTDNLKESYDVYCQAVEDYWKLSDDVTEKGNIKSLPKYFVTSADIPWKDRIETQAVMQNHIDTAVSSTINLANNTKLEEIEQIYLHAWHSGLKGITIYRSGCKREGILIQDSAESKEPESEVSTKNTELKRGFVIETSNNVIGKKRKITTGCGSLHCTAFFDPFTGDLLETYFSKGSQGGCQNFMIGLSRMISLAARGGAPIEDIVDQLDSCGVCPSYAVRRATKKDTSKGSCCPMAIGNALKEMYAEVMGDLEPIKDTTDISNTTSKTIAEYETKTPCPSCGSPLTMEGGCNICKSCGWSACE